MKKIIFLVFLFCLILTQVINAERLANQPFEGNPQAQVIVVWYVDFQNPFDAIFYNEIYPDLKSEYIDSDKVLFYVKNFPLTDIHPDAQKAAEASECIFNDNISYIWPYIDIILNNQDALDVTKLKEYAEDVGADTSLFNNCLDNDVEVDEVEFDAFDAIFNGATGVPYFIILNSNGFTISFSGAQPFNIFKQNIDGLLDNVSDFASRLDNLEEQQVQMQNDILSILNTLSSHSNILTEYTNRILLLEQKSSEYEERIVSLENNQNNGASFPNYFKYLSASDRKKMVCGYAEDNNMTFIEDLGYSCNLTYKYSSSGKLSVKCKCEKV